MNISIEITTTIGSNSSSYSNDTTGPGFKHWFLYSIICVASVLFGFPTNSYVIWLIVTGTGNGLAAEFFSLNLSISEMIYSLQSLFELLRYTFPDLSKAVNFFQGIATTGRPLFQSLICVERYLAVVHPVIFLKYKPLRYRVISSVIVWVASLSGYGLVTTVSTIHVKYISVGFILTQLILFLCIQLFCLVAVLRALKQSGPGERGRERNEENHMKQRAFIIIRIITVTMVVIYVPYIISLLFSLSSSDVSVGISYISYACFGLAGLMLPFLFLHRVGKLPFAMQFGAGCNKWQTQ